MPTVHTKKERTHIAASFTYTAPLKFRRIFMMSPPKNASIPVDKPTQGI